MCVRQCPKCLGKLSSSFMFMAKGGSRRVAGEVSTYKQPPGSAMESESGSCLFGGPHRWRFGRCSKCGKSEGSHVKKSAPAGECAMGGRHVFMFSNQCTKCGNTVSRGFEASDEGLARAVPPQVQLATAAASSSRSAAASARSLASSREGGQAHGCGPALGGSASVPTLRRDGQRRPASAGANGTNRATSSGPILHAHGFLSEEDVRVLREWEIHQKTRQGSWQ